MQRTVAVAVVLFLVGAVTLPLAAQEAPVPNAGLKDAQYYVKFLLDRANEVKTITVEFQQKYTSTISSPRPDFNGGASYEEKGVLRATKDKSCINSVKSDDPMAQGTSIITPKVTYGVKQYEGESAELEIERLGGAEGTFSPPEEVGWFFPYWSLAEIFGSAGNVSVKEITAGDSKRLVELSTEDWSVQVDPERALLPVVIQKTYRLGKEASEVLSEIEKNVDFGDVVSRYVTRYEVTETQLLPNGAYGPKRLVYTTRDESRDGTTTTTRNEASLVSIKFNEPLADSIFKVELVEGMHVTETIGDRETEYDVKPWFWQRWARRIMRSWR